MEIGYWDVKGRLEPIRWLVGYLGLPVKWTEHEFKTYQNWFASKGTIGLDFPNLPYLKDGDFNATESEAIPLYLINKSGKVDLLGNNFKEASQIRQIEGVLSDIKNDMYKSMYIGTDAASIKVSFGKSVEPGSLMATKIGQLSKFLGDKEYLLGHLTYADFIVAYWLELISVISLSLEVDSPFKPFENLCKLSHRVKALPGVKERVESSKEIKYSPMFKFPCLNLKEYEEKVAACHK